MSLMKGPVLAAPKARSALERQVESIEKLVGELEDRVEELAQAFEDSKEIATFTLQESRKILGVSIDTLRRMLADPKCNLFGAKVSAGRVVIRKTVLYRFLRDREQEAIATALHR